MRADVDPQFLDRLCAKRPELERVGRREVAAETDFAHERLARGLLFGGAAVAPVLAVVDWHLEPDAIQPWMYGPLAAAVLVGALGGWLTATDYVLDFEGGVLWTRLRAGGREWLRRAASLEDIVGVTVEWTAAQRPATSQVGFETRDRRRTVTVHEYSIYLIHRTGRLLRICATDCDAARQNAVAHDLADALGVPCWSARLSLQRRFEVDPVTGEVRALNAGLLTPTVVAKLVVCLVWAVALVLLLKGL